LADLAHNPDPELLQQMNWTEQELRDFLARWKEMKQRAKEGDASAKRQYENALKSLGLAPAQIKGRNIEHERDKLFGLSEEGADFRPPAEIASEFNTFLKDRNRPKDRSK
jgi:hypothetical protein